MRGYVVAILAPLLIGAMVATGVAQTKEKPLRVGGGTPPPTKIRHVEPEYPDSARSKGLKGTVVLEVLINTKGLVDSTKIVKPVEGLTEYAIAAVKQWQYEPTTSDGTPAWVVLIAPVRFPPSASQ